MGDLDTIKENIGLTDTAYTNDSMFPETRYLSRVAGANANSKERQWVKCSGSRRPTARPVAGSGRGGLIW